MRSRTLSTLLGAALAVSGLTAVISGSAEAANAGERLYFHSAAGSYDGDFQADPTSLPGDKGPDGATLTADAPTKTADATADSMDFFGAPGSMFTPTWTLPFTGVINSICFDVWASSSTADELVLQAYVQTGNTLVSNIPMMEHFDSASPVSVKPYTADAVVRVTGLATFETPYQADAATTLSFLVAFPGDVFTLLYDTAAHNSSMIINSPTCTASTFAGGAPAPAPSSAAPSASASTAPSESASAAPTESASASASASESAGPNPSSCGGAGASGDPSAGASTEPSASGSASASASPSAGGGPPVPIPTITAKQTPHRIAADEPARDATSCRVKNVTLTTNATTVTAGNAPILSGVARDERGDAVEGATITIFTKGYGETKYTAAATVKTDSAGQYKISVRPLKQTSFGANVGGAKSTVIGIRVNTRVNIGAPAPGTVGSQQTFTGTLQPGYARVAVGLAYVANGRFIVIRQANTDGAGRYSISARLPRGTYPFVVFTSAHQGTDKGSRSVKLTVR